MTEKNTCKPLLLKRRKVVRVDLEELRKLSAGLELGDPKRSEYINARWLKYIEWWDSRSRGAKRKYQTCAVS